MNIFRGVKRVYVKKWLPVSLSILLVLGFAWLPGEKVRAEFDPNEVEQSYHGQLGYGTGLGMADKWCALPNFNFAEDGGITGWVGRNCDSCHIGAGWDPNKPEVNCLSCHASDAPTPETVETPTRQKCLSCHIKDTAKRGDLFDPNYDVHITLDPNRSCLFCHVTQNHQIAKGAVIDTSEQTETDIVVSCTMSGCHPVNIHGEAAEQGKNITKPGRLDQHINKIACETCHTDTQNRPASALLSRNWDKFKAGKPVTKKQAAGWVPEFKWYDGQGPSAEHGYMPILGYTERKDLAGAKIYPFNTVSVTWFIKSADTDPDAIPVRHVKAAWEAETDPSDPSILITTEADMQAYDDPNDGDSDLDYPNASLETEEMNFNISHSIVPKERALACDDCHGTLGRQLLDWAQLGYSEGDPRTEYAAIRNEVEGSYHGQLGYGTGRGMADKWCALPNFNFAEDGGVGGWVGRNCDECHIGAAWDPNKPEAQCLSCHPSVDVTNGTTEAPTIQECYSCHKKDTAKRGDLFDADHDIHMARDPNRSCLFCHVTQNHQIAKGAVIDTSEQTPTNTTVSCTMSGCHSANPHAQAAAQGEDIADPNTLDQHISKIACETCHTDTQNRPASALLSRNWDKFKDGMPVTKKRPAGWVPEYKWYDGQGPSSEHGYMPILGYTERKDLPGAKIYPFNTVNVTWFIKSAETDPNAIPVRHVKAAWIGKVDPTDASILITAEADMRAYESNDSDYDLDFPEAALKTEEMNFNISHSIVPKEEALVCDDCHGTAGRQLINWTQLGYSEGDPQKTVIMGQSDEKDNDDWGCFISCLTH